MMKSAPTVVLFLLFTIGVFADGDEESVSVTEGDSVTLKSGVTEIQTDDEIEWRFNGTLIATISRDDSGISVWVKADGSFRDRLQLDNQTGDLKISNIRTTDSGEYKPTISSPRLPPPEVTFTVKVVSADEVKPISLLMGDSVTLLTGLTEIQRDDVIQWRFGPLKSLVAEINRKAGDVYISYSSDGRFRDVLKLDNQTGSLNITDMRTTHSGLYEADISPRSRYTIHKTFSVTVRDEVKTVSVTEGETVTLQIAVTEIQKDDLILWKFEDIAIAEINKTDQRFNTSDGPDGRFRDRLKPDHQTGSLTITNTRTTHSGKYKLKISSNRCTINRRITVTITAVPGPSLSPAVPGPSLSPDVPKSGLSPAAVAGIVTGLLLAAAVGAAAGVFYYHHKKPQDSKDNQMQNQALKRQLADDTENVSMKNLCGSQSAGSDTENSQFREIKGNKEHGYDIL